MSIKKQILSNRAPAPIGPYSQAILKGDQLFISGQIAIDAETNDIINSDIASETRQVMKNLKYILLEAGFTFDDVVKCSIFVKDMNNFSTINSVYGESFEGTSPARETVEVSRLPKDVNVEISCIAIK